MSAERILLITGKLAEPALRRTLSQAGAPEGLQWEVAVLRISVAALMHADWVGRQLRRGASASEPLPESLAEFSRVLLPGWCEGDLAPLEQEFGVPFERGPKDLADLPAWLWGSSRQPADLSRYDIEILAEINHAPRLSETELLAAASSYRISGADVIDLGCIPGETWADAGPATRRLRGEGFRISIDSFNRAEVEASVEQGAELVLSVNQSNLKWAAQLPAELVAIPDDPRDLDSLEPTVETLRQHEARFRIDPILEPLGVGLAESIVRCHAAGQRWPDVPLMLGVGNVTELAEADTAGMSLLLAGLCQELNVTSVLTTEVINWARTAVREFDIARRLVRHAAENHTVPKHVDSRLVMLRDSRLRSPSLAELTELAGQLTDPNFRLFAAAGLLHMMNGDGWWQGGDAFGVFRQMLARSDRTLKPDHAFYLGYEMALAETALKLGKNYRQDQPLQWGLLTADNQETAPDRTGKTTRPETPDHGSHHPPPIE